MLLDWLRLLSLLLSLARSLLLLDPSIDELELVGMHRGRLVADVGLLRLWRVVLRAIAAEMLPAVGRVE